MTEIELENTRKRLVWRANHRGTKEVDLLLGTFAATHVPDMDAATLEAFEEFLVIPDPEMHLIMIHEVPVPQGFPVNLTAAIDAFTYDPAS